MQSTYSNLELVSQMTRYLVERGDTVFQIHRVDPEEKSHVLCLLDFFAPDENSIILDAGCGVGSVAKTMKAERPDLDFILLNISQAQLDYCPDEFKQVCCDFHAMEIQDKSVDAVMFNYCIGHGDIDVLFKEAARVSKSVFIYDITSKGKTVDIPELGYTAHSEKSIILAANNANFSLEKTMIPNLVYLDHFYDKMDKATCDRLLAHVQPQMFRFNKCAA